VKSTVMMYGAKVPAENAALVRSYGYALDNEAAGGGPVTLTVHLVYRVCDK